MKQLSNSTINLLLAGEGGQGVQTIAKALSELAISSGHFSTYLPSFGVEQRGTPSVAYVIISSRQIYYPRFKTADIVLIMASRANDVIEKFISPNTHVFFDSSKISHKSIPKISAKQFGIPATALAKEKFDVRSYNIIIFGLLAKHLGFKKDDAWYFIYKSLKDKFKTKEIEQKNKDAFTYGYEFVPETKIFSKNTFDTKKEKNIYRNKEKTAEIDPKKCKGCAVCILKCPVHALSFGSDLGVFSTPVPVIDLEKCIVCGNCRRFCPDGAIGVDRNER